MSIELEPNLDGKIIKAIFKSDNIEININTLSIYKSSDKNEIGNEIENYRNNNTLFDDKKERLKKFINSHTSPIDDNEVDGVFCFYPVDDNRIILLKEYFENLTSNITNISDINFSCNFYKNKESENLSITNNELTKNDFILNNSSLPNIFKKLIVIDDTINKGRTLNILLEKLLENDLIDNDTKIEFYCIYTFLKSNKILKNWKDIV